MRDVWFIELICDVLLDKRIQKFYRSTYRRGLITCDGEIDRNNFRAPIKDLVVSLAKEFGDTGRRLHQQQQTPTCVCRLRLGHDPFEFACTTDKVLLGNATKHAAETFAGAA